MSDTNFSSPVENLASDAKGYAGAQLDNVKLRTVKALSSGTGAVVWLAVVLILISVLVLTLSFAFVMWLGEKMGSYAIGAFIVSGALLVLLVIVLLMRKVLFKGTFISTFSKALFPSGTEKVRNQNDLEKAILRNELAISRQELKMNRSFNSAKQFYANPRFVADGVGALAGWLASLFGKKKDEEAKAAEAKETTEEAKAAAKDSDN